MRVERIRRRERPCALLLYGNGQGSGHREGVNEDLGACLPVQWRFAKCVLHVKASTLRSDIATYASPRCLAASHRLLPSR